MSAFGDLLALNITDEHPITIDNEHVVAWDANLQYDIHVAREHLDLKRVKVWSMNFMAWYGIDPNT